MLFAHEVHEVIGRHEAEFEAAYRDEWLPMLAKDDDARLLWFTRRIHGTSHAYTFITLTAVRDGAAWQRLAERVQHGDLREWFARVDSLRHSMTAKLLLPVFWSPLQKVDFASVPTAATEHEPSIYMEDTAMTETLSFDRELADPHCLSDEQIDALLAGAPWRRFVVVGDSIAAGIRESAPGYRDLSWAERIDEALKRQNADATYLNLGRRGARAHEVRQRQLANALEFRPDLAAVVAGGNDTLAPDCDLDHVEADLEAIITTLQASGADVITFTMLDITKALSFPDDIAALLDELATRSRAIARRHNTIHVDLYDGSFCGDADVYASDYQHASTRGHAICASLTIRGLAERLESTLRNQPQPADV